MIFVVADHRCLIRNDIVQDDAFYYFTIARNIVSGRGMTFDGLAPTTGFQPLYLVVMLPIAAFTARDIILPIHLALAALALFAMASGAFVFDLTRRLAGPSCALFTMALWCISPYFTVASINGQETGVAIFFALLILSLYARATERPSELNLGHVLLFGAIAGMGLLARIDIAFLLFAIAVDWTRLRPRDALNRWLGFTLASAGTAMLVWAPWGWLCRATTGGWLPSSGAASREIALRFGWANLQPIWAPDTARPMFFAAEAVPKAYYADVATKLVAAFLFEHPLLSPIRINIPFNVWPGLESFVLYRSVRAAPYLITTVLLLAIFVAMWRMSRKHESLLPAAGPITVVVTYCILMFFGYTFMAPVHWYFTRYLVIPILLSTIAAVACAHKVLMHSAAMARRVAGAFGLLLLLWQGVNLGVFVSRRMEWSQAAEGGFLKSWSLMQPHIDKRQRIGSFQAGIFGYFSGIPIVNLDGKVDRLAYEALRHNRLYEFIGREHIAYVLDWDWVLLALCLRDMPADRLRFVEIAHEPAPGRMVLYAVVDPARAANETRGAIRRSELYDYQAPSMKQ